MNTFSSKPALAILLIWIVVFAMACGGEGPGGVGTTGELLWRYHFNSSKDMSSAPTVAGDMVYITLWDNSLHALDQSSGNTVWSFVANNRIYSAPVVKNDVVYVGSQNKNVYALEAASGQMLWKYEAEDEVIYPVSVSEHIVHVVDGPYVYALEGSSGEMLWGNKMDVPASFSPVLADGMLFVNSLSGYLHALDASTGEEVWRHRADEESYSLTSVGGKVYDQVFSVPAVVNGVVYFGTDSGHVRALDATTGDVLWEYLASSEVAQTPVVEAGIVYAAGRPSGGLLHALDAESGELLWEYAPGEGADYVEVDGDRVYADGQGGFIYALDARSGELQWKEIGRSFGSPMLSDGVVYATHVAQTQDGFVGGVSALDAETGAILWKYDTDVGLGPPATAHEGVVYVSSLEPQIGQHLFALAAPQSR